MNEQDPEQPKLQELAEAVRQRGTTALGGLLDQAVLVHCGEASSSAAQYETVVAFAPWHAAVAVAAARSTESLNAELLMRAGAVYAVTKRAGGPFPDRIGVGRARTADVSLRMPSVSKYHAYFTQEKEGEALTLWDARGRNGTYVDGRRLEEARGVALQNAAFVGFGEEEFLFFTASGFMALIAELGSNPKRSST